jgi:VWFA-related protein
MRCSLVGACCLLVVVSLAALQQRQPTFRVGVDLVVVDAHVVDASGRPVADLRPADFTVTVDRTPRPIVSAEYIAHTTTTGVSTPPAPDRPQPLFSSNLVPASAPPGRTILLVVDEANIRSGLGRIAAQAAERFLDRALPNDRIGLVVIPRGGARLDPTLDRVAVKQALAHVVGHRVPVATQLGTIYSLGVSEAFAFLHDRAKWSEILRRECAEKRPNPPGCGGELQLYARTMMSDARQRTFDSVRALTALFDALAQLPGPKTVVLLSEELPVSGYLAEQADFNTEARRLAAAASRARATVYVLHLQGPLADVEDRVEPASTTADADMCASGLETVTSLTGGARRMVSGRVDAAFDRITLEISGYYLLGFEAQPRDRDGKAHQIKVAVARRAVDVRARRVFVVPPRAEVAPPDSSPRDLVTRLLRTDARASDIPIAVTTYAVQQPGSRSDVRVIISAEIDRAAAQDTNLTVGYVIVDPNGRNAGGAVESLSLKPVLEHPDRPLSYLGAALVPPGPYTIRLAAADRALRAGSVAHGFDARLTEASNLAFSHLVVVDPHSAERNKPRPSVAAVFDEGLVCYLEVYPKTGALPPATSLRLEIADNADGPPRIADVMTLQPGDADRPLRASGSLSLAAVPSGQYLARAVVSVGGQRVVQVSRPIRVAHPAVPVAAPAPEPRTPPPVAAPELPSKAPARQAGAAAVARKPGAPKLEQVMERAGRYVVSYGEQLSVVVGVERYTQWMQNEDYPRPVAQVLLSEFALFRAKDDWLGFRDVYEVEGKPVTARRDRLQKLVQESLSTAIDQGRKIAEESARYNLGAIQRNFNVPTTALFFLHPTNQPRFRYRKEGDGTVDGIPVWKIRYEETKKRTIIRTSAGKDMPVHGLFWIDPTDGRVVKTQMEIVADAMLGVDTRGMEDRRFESPFDVVPRDRDFWRERRVRSSASIAVTYRRDDRLGLLLPAEMVEMYEGPAVSRPSGKETVTRITCRATYSDFKRFETGGRVVVPK